MKSALDKASSTHVNKNEFQSAVGQMQREMADTKARLRLLENTTGNTFHE